MALGISGTDVELQKPINVIMVQSLLRNAKPRAVYFTGTSPGEISRHGGTATLKWRRIENIAPSTTALSELTGDASYMQGRDSVALSTTDVVATVAKYGQYVILNEEADVFNFSPQMNKIFEVIGISAGRSANRLQRNIVEDNATIVRVGNAGSDGAVVSKMTVASIEQTVNTLNRNTAMTFTPQTPGSTNIGTSPILPSYWGIAHTDVAYDISKLAGFKGVETYGSQTQTAPGEFGMIQSAGTAVRFIQSEEASIDTNSGGTTGSTDLRGATNIDLYTVPIYGMDALGSVGLGVQYPDGVFDPGSNIDAIEVISKPFGSGGTSDPFNEIMTIAYKLWHAGAVLNPAWVRAIKCGATNLSN